MTPRRGACGAAPARQVEMADREKPTSAGVLQELLREEAQLLPRLARVFRLDPSVYAEVEADPAALPAAFAVVIATVVLVGLGAPSFAGIFLGIAGAIFVWGVTAALVWAVSAFVAPEPTDYVRLLTCLGFAYAWNALALGASLPLFGFLFEWGALVLWAIAFVQATRQVLGLPTEHAVGVCAVALGAPLLFLFVVFR